MSFRALQEVSETFYRLEVLMRCFRGVQGILARLISVGALEAFHGVPEDFRGALGAGQKLCYIPTTHCKPPTAIYSVSFSENCCSNETNSNRPEQYKPNVVLSHSTISVDKSPGPPKL